jgi:hypothetical protein
VRGTTIDTVASTMVLRTVLQRRRTRLHHSGSFHFALVVGRGFMAGDQTCRLCRCRQHNNFYDTILKRRVCRQNIGQVGQLALIVCFFVVVGIQSPIQNHDHSFYLYPCLVVLRRSSILERDATFRAQPARMPCPSMAIFRAMHRGPRCKPLLVPRTHKCSSAPEARPAPRRRCTI